jgi:hypothetical protein
MRRPRVLVLPVLAAVLLASVAGPSAAQDEPAAAPATQLRVALDRVLGEHAFLIIEAMRTGLVSGAEYNAAAAALNLNTGDLIGAITGIYGEDAGRAVDEQWRNHIAFIVDYARALNGGDSAAATLADSQLQTYAADFSALLAGAIQLPEDVVLGLITEHVDQLKQVASFSAAEFGNAYPAVRDTYDHMWMIGDGLALGIMSQFPDQFTGREFAFSPATDLRLTLDRLLGEHTQLAALSMRAGISQSPDLTAAVTALNENSGELQAAIASIYGVDAGNAFLAHWRDHTDLYLDYVGALRDDDTAAQQVALSGLEDYQTDFTAFLAGANPYLSAEDFEAHLAVHTQHLVSQADSFASGNFAAAYTTQREAWTHTGDLAAGLAAAIADQFPQLFPDTAADPLAPAGAPLSWPGMVLVGAAAILLGARLVSRRRASAAARPGPGRPRRA